MYRHLKTAVLAGMTFALVACAPQGQATRVKLDRPITENYLQVVSADQDLVEVDAAGQLVRASAPSGMCIPVDSIQTSPASVFMMMRDCNAGDDKKVGGVISISISNGPLPGDLHAVEAFMATNPGLVGLGYGGDLDDVTLLNLNRDDSAVYAVVEDRSEFGPAFAGDVICRAFVELNGRMAVISMLSLRDDPRDPNELRTMLEAIVSELSAENA